MRLLLAPHCDDEILFCTYSILRFNPEVFIVTDSDTPARSITSHQRRAESVEAGKVLGYTPEFLGIKESNLSAELLGSVLSGVKPDLVFAPAIQGGHPHHDLVGRVAKALWGDRVIHYATYTYQDLVPIGNFAVYPTHSEIDLKNRALQCYKSQFPWNEIHFDAVRGKPEYYIV